MSTTRHSQRPGSSPARLAAPVLGDGGAARFARQDARSLVTGSWALLAVLGVTVLAGIALQTPCLSGGYELPRASFRMCSSPVALSLMGDAVAEAPGRITSGLPGFSLLTYWFAVFASSLLGAGAAEGMALLLVVNTAAFAAMGVGMLVLARRLGVDGDAAAWTVVGFLSPVIVFSIAQSLDPVGVAASTWACVLLTGNRSTGSLLGAGVLLALGAAASPLGFVVLVGILLGVSRDRGQAAMVLAGFAILSGLLLLADGRMPARVSLWFSDAVDRGSPASIAVTQEWGEESALTTGLLVVWGFGIVAITAMFISRSMRRPVASEARRLPADAPAQGQEPVRRTGTDLDVLREMEARDECAPLRQTVLAITVMLGFSVLVAPGSSTAMSLWLLPFAALMVPQLWAQAVWFFAELGFAVATHLADAAAVDSSTGLGDSWTGILTLLRFFGLTLVTAFAADRLVRGDDRPATPDADRGRTARAAVPRRGRAAVGDERESSDRDGPAR